MSNPNPPNKPIQRITYPDGDAYVSDPNMFYQNWTHKPLFRVPIMPVEKCFRPKILNIDSRNRDYNAINQVTNLSYNTDVTRVLITVRILYFTCIMNSTNTERTLYVGLKFDNEPLNQFDDAQVVSVSGNVVPPFSNKVNSLATYIVPIDLSNQAARWTPSDCAGWDQTYYFQLPKEKLTKVNVSLMNADGTPANINPLPPSPTQADLLNPVYNYQLILEILCQHS